MLVAHVLFTTSCQLLTSPLFPYTTLFRSYAGHSTVLNNTFEDLGYSSIGISSLTIATAFGTFQDSNGTYCTQNRSEEHTSELQSRGHLVCRLLLEKKKTRLR